MKKLANQKGLHLAIVGSGKRVAALHEFVNDFGFLDLYSYCEAAAERKWPNFSFDDAYKAFHAEFPLSELLNPPHTRALVADDRLDRSDHIQK